MKTNESQAPFKWNEWATRQQAHEDRQRKIISELIDSEDAFPHDVCFFDPRGFHFGMETVSLDGKLTIPELKAVAHAMEAINADPRLKQNEEEFEAYQKALVAGTA